MSADYKLIRRLQKFEHAIHRDLAQTQIKHVTDEYTDERIATLLAKMAEAKRWWPGRAKVNV